MKNVFKLLGLTLAVSALFLAGCKKKPVRNEQPATSMVSDTSGIDPTKVAVEPEAPDLKQRTDVGTPADDNKSVVEAIYFALDRFAVAPAERPKLQAVIKWLTENADKNLVLVGYCDWRGTAEYNLGLGDRRANAVKRYLESLGVKTERLETLSKGSTEAKQTGGESQWAKDRRVDFIVLVKMQ